MSSTLDFVLVAPCEEPAGLALQIGLSARGRRTIASLCCCLSLWSPSPHLHDHTQNTHLSADALITEIIPSSVSCPGPLPSSPQAPKPQLELGRLPTSSSTSSSQLLLLALLLQLQRTPRCTCLQLLLFLVSARSLVRRRGPGLRAVRTRPAAGPLHLGLLLPGQIPTDLLFLPLLSLASMDPGTPAVTSSKPPLLLLLLLRSLQESAWAICKRVCGVGQGGGLRHGTGGGCSMGKGDD